MSFGIISFLKSATANRGAVPVADDNPLPVAMYSVPPGGGGAAVPSGGGSSVSVSLTRTADTNAYLANDVVGAATGSTAALTFANLGAAGGDVLITTTRFEIDLAAVISGMAGFRLHFYSITPPSALGDNVAWDLPSGDRASYRGYVDLGTPVDLGSTLYVEQGPANKQITIPAGGSLFCYLVTLGAYTPSSGDVFKITLHAAAL